MRVATKTCLGIFGYPHVMATAAVLLFVIIVFSF
jgi:hypothetical protein